MRCYQRIRACQRITRDEGLSAIIVEQLPQAILNISDIAVMLDRGAVVNADTALKSRQRPELLEQLLGVSR